MSKIGKPDRQLKEDPQISRHRRKSKPEEFLEHSIESACPIINGLGRGANFKTSSLRASMISHGQLPMPITRVRYSARDDHIFIVTLDPLRTKLYSRDFRTDRDPYSLTARRLVKAIKVKGPHDHPPLFPGEGAQGGSTGYVELSTDSSGCSPP